MIGFGQMLANPAATTGQAAAFDPNGMTGMGDHFGEPNVVNNDYGANVHPTQNNITRHPVDGLRAVLTQLVRTGIPRLPLGPPKAARMGQGYNGSKAVQNPPKPRAVVQQFVPVPSPADVGPWYAGSEFIH